jgi:hypothetical protein
VNGGVGAGRKRCVTDDRFGVGVAVMGVDEVNSIVEQTAEAIVAEMPPEPIQKIAAQLIDGDLKHEARRNALAPFLFLFLRQRDGGDERQQTCKGGDGRSHVHSLSGLSQVILFERHGAVRIAS